MPPWGPAAAPPAPGRGAPAPLGLRQSLEPLKLGSGDAQPIGEGGGGKPVRGWEPRCSSSLPNPLQLGRLGPPLPARPGPRAEGRGRGPGEMGSAFSALTPDHPTSRNASAGTASAPSPPSPPALEMVLVARVPEEPGTAASDLGELGPRAPAARPASPSSRRLKAGAEAASPRAAPPAPSPGVRWPRSQPQGPGSLQVRSLVASPSPRRPAAALWSARFRWSEGPRGAEPASVRGPPASPLSEEPATEKGAPPTPARFRPAESLWAKGVPRSGLPSGARDWAGRSWRGERRWDPQTPRGTPVPARVLAVGISFRLGR
nr:translation initiation factor IF-2 [Oryctolagus cuniculus]